MGALYLGLAALLLVPLDLAAQSSASAPFQIYGGITHLSNSFNGLPGARRGLNGWDAAAAFPSWHGLRFKAAVFAFSGTNLGAPQHAMFIMGGGQYEHYFRREGLFGAGISRFASRGIFSLRISRWRSRNLTTLLTKSQGYPTTLPTYPRACSGCQV